ncbi:MULTISPECIES: GGDEF domain-containing protein [Giesbergeria]|uniref:diguanylate cyclase n=1 Tax=Giesbergeria sinuosa TaxID=80883 RepID=A0ABV9QJM9_9BURK
MSIGTSFLLIILASVVLAMALAVVSYRRTNVLHTWAGALVAHAGAYILFALRGQISDVLSIVLANTLLAITFSLFVLGVARFQECRLSPLRLWWPVAVVPLLFTLLLPYSTARIVSGAVVFGAQTAQAGLMLWQRRKQTPGRGQYILMTGFFLVIFVFGLRAVSTLTGYVTISSILDNNPVQYVSFLIVVVGLMLLSMGLVLMVYERLETAMLESQALLQQQNQALAQYAIDLQQANQQLETLSITDGLTGLFNRRHFDHLLTIEWARAARQGSAFSVLMMDVDCFKSFNDHYGHQTGDVCLVQVAQVLQGFSRRAGDVAARYGGEEFVLLLASSTQPTAAEDMADTLRQAVQALHIPHASSPWGCVTISVGVASVVAGPHLSADAVLKLADDALYAAKAAGRNRVCSAPTLTASPHGPAIAH